MDWVVPHLAPQRPLVPLGQPNRTTAVVQVQAMEVQCTCAAANSNQALHLSSSYLPHVRLPVFPRASIHWQNETSPSRTHRAQHTTQAETGKPPSAPRVPSRLSLIPTCLNSRYIVGR